MEGVFKILKNSDSSFNSIEGIDLKNTVCFFEHNQPFRLKYVSPISIRFLKKGHVNYKSENLYKNMNLNKLFLLVESRDFESYVDEKTPVSGISIYFDPLLINEFDLVKNKGHNYLIDYPDINSEPLVTELLIPKGDITLNGYLESIYFLLNCGLYNSAYMESTLFNILRELLNFHIDTFIKSENLLLRKNGSKKEIIRRIHLAKCFIHDYYDQKITLDDITKSAYLSKYLFQRYFKRFFGISPTQYLIQVRLVKAQDLIFEGMHSISEVASKCGFNSPQHFNYSFKSHFGYCPSSVEDILN
ncbi:MAG: helix-turn-helix transcriptional regulator [Flavobacteriaceae bacterium]|nr:helix-turn-helix transcriptional regulator [Flavobacteriaceae bacterium]